MDRSYRVWYLLALVLALVPAGARSLLWLGKGRPLPVDFGMAQAGEVLFKHEFKVKDPLCPEGDGVGPFFNARSCVACHNMKGPGGAGGLDANVTTYTLREDGRPPREGVIHAHSIPGVQRETLQNVHSTLPAISQPTLEQLVIFIGRSSNHCLPFPRGVHVSQRNTPALWGAKLIDDIPERAILANARAQRVKWGMAPADDESVPVGRAIILANRKVGRFGWKAQMGSLSDFVQAACANELGLGNPGQSQPAPIYGSNYRAPGCDLTQRQCDELTAFCASLPRPVERTPQGATDDQVASGKKLFTKVGCADCHTPKLGDVDGLYSDLLLHRMGQELVGGGSYGEPPLPIPDQPNNVAPSPSEWRTPPLWGVADSAPYLHDGRAKNLDEAIRMHGGQAQRSAANYAALKQEQQKQLIAFLNSLKAPG
jgi:CxxC motif-containing protein (DUF1111 family)